jgi:hypothetical protein
MMLRLESRLVRPNLEARAHFFRWGELVVSWETVHGNCDRNRTAALVWTAHSAQCLHCWENIPQVLVAHWQFLRKHK